MKPLFIGSHPAIDFLNTTMAPQGTPIEFIGEGKLFLEWLAGAGLLDAADANKVKRRFSAAELDAVAAKARKMRTWITDWLSRWSAKPGDAYEADIRRLNSLLESTSCYWEVTSAEGRGKVKGKARLQINERSRFESADELIALVAAQVALLFSNESPELVKHCAGPECTLRFLDKTKGHRRLFCSAAACGNRAKVAAFRERQREK